MCFKLNVLNKAHKKFRIFGMTCVKKYITKEDDNGIRVPSISVILFIFMGGCFTSNGCLTTKAHKKENQVMLSYKWAPVKLFLT